MPFRLDSVFRRLVACLTLLTATAWAQQQAGYRIDTFAGLQGMRDGRTDVEAVLNSPYGVAVDASGNLYIADTNNDRIRKVDADGTITTVAGTGIDGFSGDSGPANRRAARLPHWRGAGRLGQPLHRRFQQPPHPHGRCRRDDHHSGGHGDRRIQRGLRPGNQRAAQQSHWRGGG